ncbi:MAG: D-hexose-6-phosphate mutarotase [Anaerolineae bacterium]|nr:D-hexose-6-phosphate mutarotase [Anaerolineae bacterium]
MVNFSPVYSPYIIQNDSHGLPRVSLTALDGAYAEIYLHGAHITSWIPAGGQEQLFLSAASQYGPDASIRGGVPLIFPQFCNEGPFLKHGFARRMDWEFCGAHEEQGKLIANFEFKHNLKTLALWPFPFLAKLELELGGRKLKVSLHVHNSGPTPFSFTGALHTYFKINDIHRITVDGFKGCRYYESSDRQNCHVQQAQTLQFNGRLDRFYMGLSNELSINEPDHRLDISSGGFKDAVVWNPWVEEGAGISDLEPDGYLHMLCIEAALIEKPVVLAPAESWQGWQQFTLVQ